MTPHQCPTKLGKTATPGPLNINAKPVSLNTIHIHKHNAKPAITVHTHHKIARLGIMMPIPAIMKLTQKLPNLLTNSRS